MFHTFTNAVNILFSFEDMYMRFISKWKILFHKNKRMKVEMVFCPSQVIMIPKTNENYSVISLEVFFD